jgi:hypothetical protein
MGTSKKQGQKVGSTATTRGIYSWCMRSENKSVCHAAAANLCTQEEKDLLKVVRGLTDLAEEDVITLLMGSKQRVS